MYTLGQYLFSLDDPHGLLRTLDGLEPERGADGRPVHAVGNSAAVFRVRCGGRRMALRCFLRPMRHLREIYGERLHERELFLYTAPDKGFWTDVVLTDWIEGPTSARRSTGPSRMATRPASGSWPGASTRWPPS